MKSKEFPVLYKKDSFGNILFWKICVDGAEVKTIYGLLDGAYQYTSFYAEEKNVNKSNYRDPHTQAKKEAESKWTKQKKYNGYFETIYEAENYKNKKMPCGGIKPMKAHKWQDHKHKLEYPLYIQPKIDGMRCIAMHEGTKVKLFASSGRQILHMNHIKQELMFLMKIGEIWDGEIYLHGMPLNRILGIVKSEVNPKNEETQKMLRYHVFDAIKIDQLESDDSFAIRLLALRNRLTSIQKKYVAGVQTWLVETPTEADEKFLNLTIKGYEGIMYRAAHAPYEYKRSYNIQKRKNFKEEEFPILGVEEGKGKAYGLAVNFICEAPNGETFSAPINGTEEYRIELLNNPKLWENKFATVRFLNYSEYGIPICLKAVAIRNQIGLD